MTQTNRISEKLFDALHSQVMRMLHEQLPQNLFYHCPEHTLDVIQSAERIGVSEKCSAEEILILKTAALFHDTGYTLDMREHEKHGCTIATSMLEENGISKDEIESVCKLIMATKVPQQPQSKLEEIICDADLDYLGRDDYFRIAENLYREFFAYEKIKSEQDWMQMQINFLQSHSYFTPSSTRDRQPVADMNLKKIKEAVAG